MGAAPQATPAKRFTKMDRLALLFIALWFLSDAVFLLTLLFLGPLLIFQIVIGFLLGRFVLLLLYAILYVKWSSAPTPSSSPPA
jgi:hypothetical protein